jgi:tetratricopeptide (TPR) repeat protein
MPSRKSPPPKARSSKSRPPRPKATTFASYLDRRILTPLELIGWNTNNQHAAPARLSQVDRCRLAEAWGYLVPTERDAQSNRLALYNMELRWLRERKDWATLQAMYTAIAPELPKVKARFPDDPELRNRVAWTWFDQAYVLDAMGRGPEAVAPLDSVLNTVRAERKEGADVKSNSIGLLQNIAAGHVEKGRYAEAEALLEKYLPHAAGDTNYPRTRAWLHQKWALKHWNAGQWSAALAQFEKQERIGVSDDKPLLRENMVNAYVNWAVDAKEKGDLMGVIKVLSRCKERLKAQKCTDLLNRLSASAGP